MIYDRIRTTRLISHAFHFRMLIRVSFVIDHTQCVRRRVYVTSVAYRTRTRSIETQRSEFDARPFPNFYIIERPTIANGSLYQLKSSTSRYTKVSSSPQKWFSSLTKIGFCLFCRAMNEILIASFDSEVNRVVKIFIFERGEGRFLKNFFLIIIFNFIDIFFFFGFCQKLKIPFLRFILYKIWISVKFEDGNCSFKFLQVSFKYIFMKS